MLNVRDTILSDDALDGLDETKFLRNNGLVGVSPDCVNGLRGLDDPDRIADDSRRRS